MRGKRSLIDCNALVREINKTTPGDPLARIAAAVAMADGLREVADIVTDHFVAAARESECSWSQIGGALGVSKQAAQQRHVIPEFPLYTTSARHVIELADEEAGHLGHNFIGLEHVAIGLAGEKESVAGAVLSKLGVTPEVLRAKVRAAIGAGPPYSGPRPYTTRAKKVLTELAPQESSDLGHDYVGTEHLLLAICAHGSNMGAEALRRAGLALPEVRTKVLEELART